MPLCSLARVSLVPFVRYVGFPFFTLRTIFPLYRCCGLTEKTVVAYIQPPPCPLVRSRSHNTCCYGLTERSVSRNERASRRTRRLQQKQRPPPHVVVAVTCARRRPRRRRLPQQLQRPARRRTDDNGGGLRPPPDTDASGRRGAHAAIASSSHHRPGVGGGAASRRPVAAADDDRHGRRSGGGPSARRVVAAKCEAAFTCFMFMFRRRRTALAKRLWKARVRCRDNEARCAEKVGCPPPSSPQLAAASQHAAASAQPPSAAGGDTGERRFRNALFKRLDDRQLETLLRAVDTGGMDAADCVIVRPFLFADPTLICCRLWRWPDLRTVEQLKNTPACQTAKQPDLVCCNPYHWSKRCEIGKPIR